jgi:hypothetical protein
VVRNNVIFDCGQAGIVGSLGGVFSQICHNHIYDIWTRRIFSGAEMAGIKIHASIDMLIKDNRIHNTGRGIWIDWMAQGTRITGNLLYDNTTDDLFAEVNHGPYLVDNNLFLSELSLRDWSEGGGFVHNLFAGMIEFRQVLDRFTPYHYTHSTRVAGLRNTHGGDNRFFNNIFLGIDVGEERFEEAYARFYGLHGYRIAGFENRAEGNVYYGGSRPGEEEKDCVVKPDSRPSFAVEEKEGSVFLKLDMDEAVLPFNTSLVTTVRMGMTLVSEAIWEKPDGTPYRLDKDFSGNDRDDSKPVPGPFETTGEGTHRYEVWK